MRHEDRPPAGTYEVDAIDRQQMKLAWAGKEFGWRSMASLLEFWGKNFFAGCEPGEGWLHSSVMYLVAMLQFEDLFEVSFPM